MSEERRRQEDNGSFSQYFVESGVSNLEHDFWQGRGYSGVAQKYLIIQFHLYYTLLLTY